MKIHRINGQIQIVSHVFHRVFDVKDIMLIQEADDFFLPLLL